MEATELQRDVRSALVIAYELLRHEHVHHREWVADALGELESELKRIETKLGSSRPTSVFPNGLSQRIERLEALEHDVGPVVGEQIRALLRSTRWIGRRLFALRPSVRMAEEPLFGAGVCVLSTATYARRGWSRLAGAVLGLGALALCARRDARTRLGRGAMLAVPADEELLWGALAVTAPFVVGRVRRDWPAASVQIGAGMGMLLVALVDGVGLETERRRASCSGLEGGVEASQRRCVR